MFVLWAIPAHKKKHESCVMWAMGSRLSLCDEMIQNGATLGLGVGAAKRKGGEVEGFKMFKVRCLGFVWSRI